MLTIKYYFWLMSDWAYFGSERLANIAKKHEAVVEYYPIRLPDVYARTGGVTLDKRSKQRQDYRIAELKRWRERLGMPLTLNPAFFPTNVDLASQAIYAAVRSGADPGPFSAALLRAVWAEDRDISSPAVIRDVADGVGLNGTEILSAAHSDDAKAAYEQATLAAPEQGVFGSPFYIFNEEVFWGQDRLDFLDDALTAFGRGQRLPNA